jgi:phosphotransferase system HPr (HPr) family protein
MRNAECGIKKMVFHSAFCIPHSALDAAAMNGETLRQKVVITNPQGFHMRPLTAFVQLANQFQSTVTVCKDGQRSNGRSALELMALAAEQGTELVLEVSGSDARAALDALARLLASPSPEADSGPPLPQTG